MLDERERAFAPVLEHIQRKLEAAFNELDDIMVAMAPDAPPAVAEAWLSMHSLMTPDFLRRRDRMRGVAP